MEFWCRKCFGSKGCLGNFDQELWSVTSSFTWSRMEWCIPSVLLGYFHPLGCFRKFDQFEILAGPAWWIQTFPRTSLVLTHFDLILSNFCCLWLVSKLTLLKLRTLFQTNFFQKQSCPGDSQKKHFLLFEDPFLKSQKILMSAFWAWTLPILCPFCPRMHVFCSKSTHVESDALNSNNRIFAPKNLTEPKNIDNHKFGLFLFLLTIPRGLRPRGPPLHIQGHSSPDGLGCNYLFSGRSNRS